MNRLLKLLFIGVLCFITSSLFAADIPADDIGSQEFDQTQCVSDATQTCINEVCLTSEQRDCQDTCEKLAIKKCAQQANE